MRVFRVSSADANILYHDIPGSGAPLVFIHGLGCASSSDYPSVVSDAMLTGRRSILVDLLGSVSRDNLDENGATIWMRRGGRAKG